MRLLRLVVMLLSLALAPGCILAGGVHPAYGHGYGPDYGPRYGGYLAPPPHAWGAKPYHAPRPYIAPRPYYAPPPPAWHWQPRPHWHGRPHAYRW